MKYDTFICIENITQFVPFSQKISFEIKRTGNPDKTELLVI